MSKKRILTLDDLYNFLVSKNQNFKFSKQKEEVGLIIGLEGNLTFNKDTLKDGLVPIHLKAAHCGKNKNHSKITEAAMKRNLNSIKNRPILAYIHQIKMDGETKDVFGWHAMHEDDDGNIIYDEIPCGHIPSDAKPSLIYDSDADKKYIEVDGYLYTEYTKAVEILEDSEGQCPVSVEIDVNDFSYDAKEKLLSIDDFIFKGTTILGYYEDGTEVQPAMEGANISLMNFTMSNNSFEINQNSMKGGNEEMNLFEQLLEQYNVTVEDITFDYENMSDEELTAKFEEVFGSAQETSESTPTKNFDGEETGGETTGEEQTGEQTGNQTGEQTGGTNEQTDDDNDDDDDEEEQVTIVNDEIPVKKVKASENEQVNIINYSVNGKEFSVSLNDKIYALSALVNDAYSESDNAYYSVIVYDKELVMIDCWAGSAYRQSYSERSGVFSLKGDRVPVHAIYVTDTEEQKLDEIRSKYSVISAELQKYQKAEEQAKKENIVNSSEWEMISNTEEFARIKEHFAEYSIEELQTKCDQLLLSYIKKNTTKMSEVPKDTSVKHTFGVFRFPETSSVENKRYGNLFD